MPSMGPKGALMPTAYVAGAAIVACRILKAGADADHAVHASAASSVPIGISEEDQPTAELPVRVAHRPGELVRVEAGAALSAAAKLTSDSTGRAITATTGNQVVGIARNAALAAGDLITVEIQYGVV